MSTTVSARTDSTFNAAPGSVVVVRDEDWLVTGVEPAADGFFVHVVGLSELVRDTEATFSTALDTVHQADPAATRVKGDESKGNRRTRLWLEAMLRKTPVPIADPSLTTAHRALADPLEYQFAAVRKALDPDNLRPRILLADAVGLGKTLEIGMILSELVRRGRGERILVVTPKHVLEQMQFELWTRFALPFVRLDSTGIQRIRQKLPANRNPFTYFKRVIISIDTLKSDKYVAHLRKQRWDAVVIDESHNVTNTSSQNNRLATLLAARTDALILASATPHNGKAESFAELVRMLEPSAVKPDGTLVEDEVQRLIIRRHRHHPDVASVVGAAWAERLEPDNQEVAASPVENEIARELAQTWLWPEGGVSPYSGKTASLFPWTLAKAFLSSPAALAASVRERLKRLGDGPAAATERAALETLQDLAELALRAPSGKYDALLAHLRKIKVGPASGMRAVVFAERVATLDWLQQRLMKDLRLSKEQVGVLHGGLSDTEQQDIVDSFKLASSPIRVLVTGDVASEGVNLHSQCHHLVHFDIPWSLIRIEQRNGRIDRYGQKHPPQITTLLLSPEGRFGGDFHVLTKLVAREHEAHKALGDTASLMGTYDVVAEEDAIRDVIRGRKQLEDVVSTVEEVAASAGPAGFLARLMSLGSESAVPDDGASPQASTSPSASGGSGVYDDELSFLEDALLEAFETPGLPVVKGGVSWKSFPQQQIVSIEPPRDLRQRLEVLPQSYLAARRVTETLRLATSTARGKREIEQAKNAESTSTWPEAHYLAPLHPIVDWAADRALAKLGRDEVFAVRGDVEELTVLLQATLTNKRGQVVATSYLHVVFPDVANARFALVQVRESGQDAVESLRLAMVNTGALVGAERLQPFVAAAVGAATAPLEQQIAAIRAETESRVKRWLERSKKWRMEADVLVQRQDLERRREDVNEESELAQSMLPDRTLVRPLVVVVPAGTDMTDIVGDEPAHAQSAEPLLDGAL
ncbi:helicase-related protein [Oerskovia enterophila]|uniref:helicase-related protein n=1 Tax=Oerskovia enterophila TaxID=43678 RepID=UPI00380F06DB